MGTLTDIYRAPLALLTDLYQLTMAYGYWKTGRAEQEAVFHLFFRKNPFRGGYTIATGLQYVMDYLDSFQFSADDVQYLAGLEGNDGQPLFERGFLEYLAGLRLRCDVDAAAEGTVVFPHQPLVRVKGPILQCQILETALLNIINYQSLIATKASRISAATGGDAVLEFGLRRAQGIDGALAASRAAYIGGCDATSNVLAGKLFGIPVKGTHAHSWVMSFDDEMSAFEGYASAMPNNCVFLVDTYDTIEGVRNAIEVGRRLRETGHEMVGVRLDSGDLAYLSIAARRLLDEAGFPNAAIVASNDLDEGIIASLKDQGAKIAVWGVGTKLVTGYDQPALGGVYKLGAMKNDVGEWQPKVKLSEQAIKTSTPGMLQIRRFCNGEGAVADMIYNELDSKPGDSVMVDPLDPTRRRRLDGELAGTDLLIPVVRNGQVVHQQEELAAIRERAKEQLALFDAGIRRHINPHEYPVGLEQRLHDLKTELILRARGVAE
ncbi:MAG: nicotinate phosphoribosyltransferase [Pirellulaceae bacterium]|jgi:nicotinate phosphoribosyltransferase|nr:nicotinate phosphoribosyltransferase [Planctomycetaceae bacterium]MDP6554410.1 nicotinate phosphoribosyltransferase [Pirellulaceae bacterium]MDP6718937.1 nicotinate phosphoribosyltransferase [Pirellulaceae bacterium]